jgi:hypothetical protein
MNVWTLLATSVAAAIAPLAAAQCPNPANDCCLPGNGTPGCSDEACCNAVCAIDPFCCTTAWDSICAGEAATECPGLCNVGGPCDPGNPNDCCVANGTPGCGDVTCCEAVCAIDPFCCDTSWDGICAGEAATLCKACIPDPVEEIPACEAQDRNVDENEPCGTDTNGGCNNPNIAVTFIAKGDTVTGNYWAFGGTRDTDWYQFDITADRQTTWTVWPAAGVNTAIFLLDANCPPTVIAQAQGAGCPICCSAFLPVGTYRAFVATAAFDGLPCFGGQYFARLDNSECVPPQVCGPDNPQDCCFPGQGLPGCNDQACCEAVCAIDPFCCDTAWDSICAGEAATLCEQCMGQTPCSKDNPNDCFQPGSGPGCNDVACCEAVCAVDPFCCDTSWDGICAGEAASLCGEPLPNDECEGRLPIFDGDTEYTTIGATTSLPPLEPVCEEGFGLAFVNDIWFNWVATCTGIATFSTCNQVDYDSRLALYLKGTDPCVGELIACNDDGVNCGLTSLMTANVTAGTTYLLRVGGFSGSGSGTLTISCAAVCIPGPDRNGDGCVNGADLGIVIGNWDPDGSLGNGFGPGDANCDGVVNGADIGIVIGGWTSPPC